MLWYNAHKFQLNLLSCIFLIGLLTACSSTSSSSSANHPVLHPSPTAQQPSVLPTFTPPTTCQTASPIDNSSIGPEAQGSATNAQLWALIMSTTGIPVQAKHDVKIVWRMTGSGNIHFAAYNSTGRQIVPIWGPDEHGGSNWNRPGEEWGAGFNFPVSGCWDIHVMRDNAAGDLWLDVH